MAGSLLTSPLPKTREPTSAQKRRDQAKGYRKIRFKAWAPTLDGQEERNARRVDDRQYQRTDSSNSFCGNTGPDQNQLLDTKPVRAIENTGCIYLFPSPLTKLPANGIRQDPFVALPIKATGCVPATLDYFIQVVSPAEEAGLLVERQMDHHMTLLFPFMLQHAPLFHSIIALCRGSILISLGKLPMDDKAVMYHCSKAVMAVTESLGNEECNSDTTLLTISMLLTLEYLSGNAAGVAAHVAGLDKLMALRTDLDDSTPWKSFVKRGLEAYKSLGSFVTGRPPEIPHDSRGFIEEAFAELSLDRPTNYPGLPFDPDLCTVLSRLPSGFSELCLSGHISTQTMHVLASLTAMTICSETEIFDDSKLESELQAMLSALQRLSLMKITPLEKYLTCGLVAWSFQLRKLRPLNLFHDPPLRTFVKLAPAQERPDSVREQRCLIWISIAIAGALNLRSIAMPGTHLVLDRLFTLYPVSRDWESFIPILKSFYWTEKIGAHWKKCWDEGIKRWHFVQARGSPQSPFQHGLAEREESSEPEEPDEITIADIAAHMRAAPVSMMEAFQAAQCPFLQKAKSRKTGT